MCLSAGAGHFAVHSLLIFRGQRSGNLIQAPRGQPGTQGVVLMAKSMADPGWGLRLRVHVSAPADCRVDAGRSEELGDDAAVATGGQEAVALNGDTPEAIWSQERPPL